MRRRLPWPWAASIALHGAIWLVGPQVAGSAAGELPYGASAFGDDDAGVLVDIVPWPADREVKDDALPGLPPAPVEVVPASPPSKSTPRVRPTRRRPKPARKPPKVEPPKPTAPKPEVEPPKPTAPKPEVEPSRPSPDPTPPAPRPKPAATPTPVPAAETKPMADAKSKADTKPAPATQPASDPKPASGSSEPGAGGPAADAKPAAPGAEPVSPDPSKDGDGEGGRKKARRGYRPLARAFSRELPFAVSRDPIWEKLPLGEVGSVTVVATIGENGRIQKLVARDGAPAPLARAVKRTRPSLGGRFRLSEGEVAGEEVLRIDIRLEQRDPPAKQRIHYDVSRRPTPKQPGRVFFITESGRYFEATVTIVSSTPQ